MSTVATRAQSDTELSKHCPCHPLNLFHYTCLHHSIVMHRQMHGALLTLRSKSKQKRLLCVYENSWFKHRYLPYGIGSSVNFAPLREPLLVVPEVT